MGVTAFLPCRAGSERVKKKNTRAFGSSAHSLIEIKLEQLNRARLVDRIVVSTNDKKVHAAAKDYSKATVHWRDSALCRSDASTDDLIPHAVELIPDGDILWTHCTSPFVTAQLYDRMVAAYHSEGEHDSVMLVRAVQGFYWYRSGPLNYAREAERWPRTQTIEPMYKVTSGGFLASADTYRNGDRIGERPMLIDVGVVAAMDIDTPEEFALAEELFSSGYAEV